MSEQIRGFRKGARKMSEKKIAILDTGKEWGGGTNSLIELLKRIDRKRYRFSALFYHNYRMGPDSDIGTELERLGVKFILLGRGPQKKYIKVMKEAVRVLLFPSPALKKRYLFNLDYRGRILSDSKRIAAVLKEGGFDLLYMNNQPSSNLEGILAARGLNIPCVQHSRIEVSLNPFEADAVNSSVAKVICVSKGVMEGLVRSGVRAELCRVVYNGIDPSVKPGRSPEELRRELGVPEGSIVIGTVGSLVKRKRVDMILQAMGELKNTGTVCLMVGDGPEMESLKETASRLGVTDRVIFTGFSSDPLSYINAMDIFISASEKEGLPRVVLEAMLMGKPVVAIDITGTKELVIDNTTGILLKGGGSASIASAVKGLSGDRARMRSFGDAGRDRVAGEFGIDRYVSGVSAVFDEVFS